jgi:hypothetical protein
MGVEWIIQPLFYLIPEFCLIGDNHVLGGLLCYSVEPLETPEPVGRRTVGSLGGIEDVVEPLLRFFEALIPAQLIGD